MCFVNNAGNSSKVTPKKTYYENSRGGADYVGSRSGGKGNWRGKGAVSNRKAHKYERFASGSSYLKPDGNVKETTKKISLNHLLNFKFEPRNVAESPISSYSRPNKKNLRRSFHGSDFSKERFLQANCEFVVCNDADYSVHYEDPDVPIPWDKVEQVRMKSEKDWFCPICLYPPSVAKITKCGHTYCWPCILHYLALEDKTPGYRDCPICHVGVKKEDLRSVIIEERAALSVGSQITMELFYRNQISLIPRRWSQSCEGAMSKVLEHSEKISKYSAVQVLDLIVDQELEELKCKLSGNLEDLEKIFVEVAIVECEKKKSQLLSDISQQCEISDQSINSNSDSVENIISDLETPNDQSASCNSDSVAASFSSNSQHGNGHPSVKSKKPSVYYFYRHENGANVFLNGINVKCLLKEYGSFPKCPLIITGELVNVESFVMTEDLRKRHKYLSHLPLSCEYSIIELDLRPPVVSEATLEEFKSQIRQKKAVRQKKEREENASRRRAEIQEQRKLQDFIRTQSSGQSYSVLANSASTGSVSVFVASGNQNSNQLSSQHLSSGMTSPDYGSSPQNRQDSDTRSFAEMLKQKEIGSKPMIKSQPMKPTLANAEYNNNLARVEEEDDPEDPFYVAPTYKSSFGDALSSALDAIEKLSVEKEDTSEESSRRSKKKQKRKKKQTLLFSTSAQLHHL